MEAIDEVIDQIEKETKVPWESNPASSEIREEQLPNRAEVIKDYLSYADADISEVAKKQSLEYSKNSPQATKYADALIDLMGYHDQQELRKVVDQMRVMCAGRLLKYDILPRAPTP